MSSAGSPGGFFSSMLGQGGGMGGSPSSFMSPPMDPGMMAMLMKLMGGGQGGGGMTGLGAQAGTPNVSGAAGGLPPNATLPPGASIPGQQPRITNQDFSSAAGGMPAFGSINPQMIQMLLQRMGMGGQKPAGATP